MTFTMEFAPVELALSPAEQQPQNAEELESQVLALVEELDNPNSWLHQNFYGPEGVTPTEMVRVNRPTAGHNLYVKNETEHHLEVDGQDFNAATFKRRGALLAALVAVRDNPDLERFVTASAGNHALGVAFAARALGKEAHIYCRSDISEAKEKKLLQLDAVLHKNEVLNPEDDTLEYAMNRAVEASQPQEDGSQANHFIHPFDQVEVIAGQYTVGREMVDSLEQQHLNGALNVFEDPIEIEGAVGGGGHLAGVALAVKHAKDEGRLGDNVRVRGAQVEGGRSNTWCDGTATNPGRLPLLILCNERYVDNVDIITNEELADAMVELTGVFNKMAEPAGSLSYALAKKRAAARRMDTLRAKHEAKAAKQRAAGVKEDAVPKPTTYITTFTGANTARHIYEHFTNIRDNAYRENLRYLGSLTARRRWQEGVDAVAAHRAGNPALSGRVLR